MTCQQGHPRCFSRLRPVKSLPLPSETSVISWPSETSAISWPFETPCSKSPQTSLTGPNLGAILRNLPQRRGKRSVARVGGTHHPLVKPFPMIPGPDPAPIIARTSSACSHGRGVGSVEISPLFFRKIAETLQKLKPFDFIPCLQKPNAPPAAVAAQFKRYYRYVK